MDPLAELIARQTFFKALAYWFFKSRQPFKSPTHPKPPNLNLGERVADKAVKLQEHVVKQARFIVVISMCFPCTATFPSFDG